MPYYLLLILLREMSIDLSYELNNDRIIHGQN
jgi:hypothetical protein